MLKAFKSSYLWVLVCVVLISAIDGWQGKRVLSRNLDPSLLIKDTVEHRKKLQELTQAQAKNQAGEMISLRDQSRFPSHSINAAISHIPGNKRHSNFVWQDSSGGTFAFAARAVDKNHYFSNSYLVGFLPFETDKIWVPLATLAQRKIYQLDHERYGLNMPDVWQNSEQAYLNSHGDCEDHAIILADWLVGMGHDARVVVGQLPEGGHAWVVLFHQNKEYVLEATSKRRPRSMLDFKPAKLATEYRPKYMFNRDYFWENKGSVFTTRYSGKNWHKRSKFSRS